MIHICIFAQLDHDTDTVFRGLVCDIHDVVCLFCFRQGCHIEQEFGNAHSDHRIWDLRDHNIGLAGFSFFDIHFTAESELSASGLIDGNQIIFITYYAAGRKIGTFQVMQKLTRGNFRITHIGFCRIDHFS